MAGLGGSQQTPCPPTREQLADDPVVVRAMHQAWRESNPGARRDLRREQGGWIYVRNGRTIIRRARAGGPDSIDLNNPPQIPGALLVGDFHTHPGFKTQTRPGSNQTYNPAPSDPDVAQALARGVPGLVISEGMKITPYGPKRRGGDPMFAYAHDNPLIDITGYPGNTADTTHCP